MLTKQEITSVQLFLEQLRDALPAYQERTPQREMMSAVAKTFDRCRHGSDTSETDGANFLLCQAGTGCGKTFAYSVPGLVLARSVGKKLVISSSTISLQEQIMSKDLPLLQRCAPFSFSYAIGKGRSRYACTVKLNALADKAGQGEIRFDEEKAAEEEDVDAGIVTDLARRLAQEEWNGDQDRLDIKLPEGLWERVTTDRNGCAGNKCPEFARCPFFRARRQMQEADVIVANHDLVLAALEMQPGAVLPDPAECFFVFDEAHSLPMKVLSHYAERHSVRAVYGWLNSIPETVMNVVHSLGLGAQLHVRAQTACMEVGEALRGLIHWIEREVGADEDIHRFRDGVVPDDLSAVGEALQQAAQSVLEILAEVRAGSLKKAAEQPELAQALLAQAGEQLARVESLVSTWRLMLKEDRPGAPPTARWIEKHQSDHCVAASPINAGERLARMLWRRASAVVMTSATLTSCGSFDNFKHQTGLDRFSAPGLLQLESPFDYANRARIVVPRMKSDPGDHVAHTAEVANLLLSLIQTKGTLVLYASGRQMREVYDLTQGQLPGEVLMQGSLPKGELIRRHCAAVSGGAFSVIFGLASLAEGIDLPGELCTHVIVPKLPFPVPDHPLEEARREWIERRGGSAFHEAMLPEAAIKLAQMVGRLVRTEDDSGQITILDPRIGTKAYGRQLLRGLPPMAIEIFGRPVQLALPRARGD